MNVSTKETNKRRATAWPDGRITVGVDGSPCSISALRYAFALAELSGADVEAVTAWHETIKYGPAWSALMWSPIDEARNQLHEAITSAGLDTCAASVRTIIRRGAPAQVLIERSKASDLLIVGSRGHGGFAGLLLGSVSSTCAEHARCPVLVLHESAGLHVDQKADPTPLAVLP